MSSLPEHDLVRYTRTRFPLWLALSLPALISTATVLGALRTHLLDPITVFILAVLLVFEFRLWDDLADRKSDQQQFPERILGRTTSLHLFHRMLGILIVVNFSLMAIFRPWWSLTGLFVLHLLIGLWYWARDRIPISILPHLSIWNYHVILSKYPAFVLILGAVSPRELGPSLFIGTCVVYLALCVFEVLHDARLRTIRSARMLLVIELGLLLCMLGFAIETHFRTMIPEKSNRQKPDRKTSTDGKAGARMCQTRMRLGTISF